MNLKTCELFLKRVFSFRYYSQARMNQQSLPATRIVSQSPRTDMPFLARYNDEATSPAPGFCSWDPFLARMGTPTMALR
jgi:hypothetical protein